MRRGMQRTRRWGAVVMLMTAGMGACGAERVREASLAGTWYPEKAADLRGLVEHYVRTAADPTHEGQLIALIAPHAGYRYSGAVAGAAYKQVRKDAFDRVIVLAPSHQAAFRGFSIMDTDAYRTPLGDAPLDADVCKTLRAHALHVANDAFHKPEHAIEIQVPFLQTVLDRFTLVPVLVGELREGDAEEIAAALRPHVSARTLIVASSDFTHYGPRFDYVPFEKEVPARLQQLDKGAADLIAHKDCAGFLAYVGKTRATICGRNPIAVLLKLLPANAAGELIRYDTSGRITGDWSNSVSYCAIAFTTGGPAPGVTGLTESEKKILLRIARTTLNTLVKSGKAPSGFDRLYPMTPRLQAPAGVFVTLKKSGDLRGCIGSIGYPETASALPPLHEGVARMAVQSATRDPRFPPVARIELDEIRIEISVLSIAAPVRGPEEFEVGRHGIIIRKGGAQAVFLPQVAPEQGWTREQTLDHLCLKAGLDAQEWRKPGMTFLVFTAEVFDETLLREERPESGDRLL